jgi:hypothetical protein
MNDHDLLIDVEVVKCYGGAKPADKNFAIVHCSIARFLSGSLFMSVVVVQSRRRIDGHPRSTDIVIAMIMFAVLAARQ